MNPFLASSFERIALWRSLRTDITSLSLEDKLSKIEEWWEPAPLSMWTIDLDFFERTHLPWELISDNVWTPASVIFMREQTLILSGASNNIDIAYITDIPSSTDLLVMMVDDKYVLNYSLGEIIDLNTIRHNIKIIKRYKWNGKNHTILS